MFRSALAAAMRHLGRGKLFAAIAVCGLAIGLCGALLAGLFIRSQYNFEHFVTGYQNAYWVTTITPVPEDGHTDHSLQTPQVLAELMHQRFPEITSASRAVSESIVVRLRDTEPDANEVASQLMSVDPNFFDTLPLKVLAGDPGAALAQPDTVVMTSGMAQRIFGDGPPLGRTLEAVKEGKVVTLTVGAIVDRIPVSRSRFFSEASMFVSGESAWTGLARYSHPFEGASAAARRGYVFTVVRLKPGVSPQSMREHLPELLSQIPGVSPGERLDPLRIDRIQTNPGHNPAITTNIVGMAGLALVLLIIAGVNFVNLLTARSGARLLEIGVRKLTGAGRLPLALQFLGEALLHVGAAVVIAVAMTELLLPHISTFLAKEDFQYWKEPVLLGWMLAGTLLVGLLAGFWPAVVLSRMSPLDAMHGSRVARGRGGLVRQVLVSVQFALLTVLILKVGVTYLQHRFAMQQALRFDTDQVLILNTGCSPGRMAELRRLAGVVDAACSLNQLLGGEGASNGIEAQTRDGRKVPVAGVTVDDRMLQLYGVKLLAGRSLTAADFGLGYFGRRSTRVLINESAVRALGFDSPTAAIGPYPLMKDAPAVGNGQPSRPGFDEIVGVVPDFSMAGVGHRIRPTVFFADPMQFGTISVKLEGHDIPGTITAIERVWKSTRGRGGEPPVGKLDYVFYNDRVARMYYPMLVEGRIFAVISLVAISLALLGLLGLAASAAERRTREIGIRKALGANTGDVRKLLLWQFSKPVIWANLIAWPLAGWAMQRWLNGSAYHIDLPLWLFPATMLVTVLIALATVSAHTLQVARARPISALRYE